MNDVGDMLTSTYEVLVRAEKNGYRYLVMVLAVAEADWLAEMDAEARVATALGLGLPEVETLRRRQLTNEERLVLILEGQGQMWTREPITRGRQD